LGQSGKCAIGQALDSEALWHTSLKRFTAPPKTKWSPVRSFQINPPAPYLPLRQPRRLPRQIFRLVKHASVKMEFASVKKVGSVLGI